MERENIMKYHRYNKKTARKRFPNKQRVKVIVGCMALCIVLLGESCIPVSAAQNKKDLMTRVLERAEHSAYGAYPETVTYTLGKIAGAKNSNLPLGDTYEDNAYTRYLKKLLNIQNKDVFELEDGRTYEQAVEMAIQDKEIPDVLVVKGLDTLKQLVERGMVEDLSSVYEECTTDRIKEMYESYGTSVLDSATFDGKLYAFPDTVIDHGSTLLWLRSDWMEELGLAEPTTMD